MDTTTVETLTIDIKTNAYTASKGIADLTSSLKKLKDVCKGGLGLEKVSEELKTLATSFTASVGKLDSVNQTLSTFKSNTKGLGKDFKSASDSLEKFTDDTDDAKEATQDFQQVVSSLRSALTSIREVFNSFVSKLKRIGRLFSGFITESNSYVENLNLFRAGMREYAEEAEEYAERVSEAMGLDPGQFMRYQGVFNAIIKGFGVAGDKAAFMSQNLTSLGYDLASLYNVEFEEAMEKLQSAISGQVKGVREYGYDILDTTLQQIALANGIDKSTDAMTQAEKVQLRYIALMQEVQFTQTDMARTLNSPANQLRILNQQITLLKRSLGNVIMPILTKVLPYLIAIVKVLRMLAEELAALMGFELPEFEYPENVSEGFEEATESAKKFKNLISGFDELNIMSGNKEDNSIFDIDLPGYDALAGLVESKVDEITEKLKENLNQIKLIIAGLIIVGGLFEAISVTVNGMAVFGEASKMITLLVKHPEIGTIFVKALQIVGAIALAGLVIYMLYKNIKALIEDLSNKDAWVGIIQAAGIAVALIGALTGNLILILAGIVIMGISLIVDHWEEIVEEFKSSWEEISTWYEESGVKDVMETDVNQWLFDNVITPVKEAFTTLYNFLTDVWELITTLFKESWDNIKKTWDESGLGGIWDMFKENAKAVINSILGFFETTINSIIKAFNSISIDLPDWLPLIGGKTFGINLSLVSIPRLANGGVVDKGQMFIAREAGAEMVGAIGSKTGVANNEQIVEGITDGVRMANADVLRAIQTLIEAVQDTSITIGDETIARSAARGNNSYRKMTGRPLIV